MLSKIRAVGIVGKHREAEHIQSVNAVIDYCLKRGLTVFVEALTAASVGRVDLSAPYEMIGQEVGLMIVVGGDGLMLAAARQMAPFHVPIVGINLGRLGFLTHIEYTQMAQQLDALFEGQGREEKRILIEGRIIRNEECLVETASAMNDIYISRGSSGRMIEFEIIIDGEFVYHQRADGMIVSTATGSTAYALSANGPILHPAVPALILVPLCPHSLSSRPIAVPETATIECVLLNAADAYMHSDGQSESPLYDGDIVRISRYLHPIRLLLPPSYRYFDVLREKLHWSDSPTRHSVS